MLKVILNKLKSQAEEIIAEEQAGFCSGRSTTEQVFNIRVLCEKYSRYQQDIYHVFIDFIKAFRRYGSMGHDEQLQHEPEVDQHHETPVRNSQQ